VTLRRRTSVILLTLAALLPGCVLVGIGSGPPERDAGPGPAEVARMTERYLAALRDGDLEAARREVCTEGFFAASEEDFHAFHGRGHPRPASFEVREAVQQRAGGGVGAGTSVTHRPEATVRFEDGQEVEVTVWFEGGGVCDLLAPDDPLAERLDPSPKGAAR
jgi:hypothetical protein